MAKVNLQKITASERQVLIEECFLKYWTICNFLLFEYSRMILSDTKAFPFGQQIKAMNIISYVLFLKHSLKTLKKRLILGLVYWQMFLAKIFVSSHYLCFTLPFPLPCLLYRVPPLTKKYKKCKKTTKIFVISQNKAKMATDKYFLATDKYFSVDPGERAFMSRIEIKA